MSLDNATVNSRLVVILIVIVGLIAGIGVIISAVSLGRPTNPHISISQTGNSQPLAFNWTQSETNPNPASRRKRDVNQMYQHNHGNHGNSLLATAGSMKPIWTVAVGYDNGPHDYRDEQGDIRGFSKDIVDAVCDTLEVECRVVYDRYQNCWSHTDSHYSSGGQGLLGQWYDACVGWASSRDRNNVFDFSAPYAEMPSAKLYVSKDSADETSENIAFVRGFAADDACLKAGGVASQTTTYVDTPADAVELLRKKLVGAVFASPDTMAPYADHVTEADDKEYTCANGGYSIMTRKDSSFADLWNAGFQAAKKTGLYQNVCKSATENHGSRGAVKCIENKK